MHWFDLDGIHVLEQPEHQVSEKYERHTLREVS